MMLTAAAAAFLLTCAPNVADVTMAGLIEHESGWHQYAIGDNTARRSYSPATYWDAVDLAKQLRGQGHDIDAGLAQINDSNWSAYGLDEYSVFDPCRNVRVGATILGHAYAGAARVFPDQEDALRHALSAYNSGHFYASLGYANSVIENARNVRFLQPTPVQPLNVQPPRPEHAVVLHPLTGPALPVRKQSAQALHEKTQLNRAQMTTTVLSWALPVRSTSPNGGVR